MHPLPIVSSMACPGTAGENPSAKFFYPLDLKHSATMSKSLIDMLRVCAQIAKESWLPKMVGPVSNSGRKGKTKQKGSKAQSHADKAKRVEAKGSGESEVDSPSTASAASSAKDVPSRDEQLANVRQEIGSREIADALPQAAVAAAQPEPQASGRQADLELQGTKPSKAAALVTDAQKQAAQMPATSRQPMGPTVTKAEVLTTTPKQSTAKSAKSRLHSAETIAAPKSRQVDATVRTGQRTAADQEGLQEGVRSIAPEGNSLIVDRAVLHTRNHSGWALSCFIRPRKQGRWLLSPCSSLPSCSCLSSPEC